MPCLGARLRSETQRLADGARPAEVREAGRRRTVLRDESVGGGEAAAGEQHRPGERLPRATPLGVPRAQRRSVAGFTWVYLVSRTEVLLGQKQVLLP